MALYKFIYLLSLGILKGVGKTLVAAGPKGFCRKPSGYGWFDKSRVHVYVCSLCSVHFFDVRN